VAKGLGGGYATVGAILMSKKIADGIRDGSGFWKHGHTYQGHPVACATSLAVQKVMKEENLLENCRKQGAYLGMQHSFSMISLSDSFPSSTSQRATSRRRQASFSVHA